MYPKFNLKTICSYGIVFLLLTTSCSNDNENSTSTSEETTTQNPVTPNTGNTTQNPVTTNLKMESSNTFCTIKLSADEYNYWNSNPINSKESSSKIKALCKKEIYPILKDDFDFIIVVMNNTDLPKDMPYGEYYPVKNDIQGIGMSAIDYTAEFGSSGKLQGVYFLYKNNIDLGPVLHEMCHRWGNWIVPQNYAGHWDNVKGILTGVSNNFADIELYLAGAIPASEIKDSESLAIYNDSRYTNKTRVPSSTNSQKNFKSLVVVLGTADLTETEINTFKNRISNITRTPAQGTTNSAYQNLYNKTGGLLTLSIGELDKSKK